MAEVEAVHFPPIINLNVGGVLYQTSLQTLTRDHGSMLYTMFTGSIPPRQNYDGSYPIDRDGKSFRHILNFLRDGKLFIDPEDGILRQNLLQEANYFQIQGMINLLRPYGDSMIMTPGQRQWLSLQVGWLHYSRLIYRLTRHGSSFHGRCDGKGPTVTVIRLDNDVLIGGYTSRSWETRKYTSNGHKPDSAAFLFSLYSNWSLEPFKMCIRDLHASNAIYNDESFGPAFGCQGGDLHILNYGNRTYACDVKGIGTNYKIPSGMANSTFLNLFGEIPNVSYTLPVSEIEVFELMKQDE